MKESYSEAPRGSGFWYLTQKNVARNQIRGWLQSHAVPNTMRRLDQFVTEVTIRSSFGDRHSCQILFFVVESERD